MSAARRLAFRLAAYLDCIGATPVLSGATYKEYCAALSAQLISLESEQRERGIREGQRRIREAPGLEKAAGHLIPVPPQIPPRPGKWRRKREKYRQKMRLWPLYTPPCPVCRIFGNLPKRSWPSFAMAEAVRLRQGDPHLRVYACPVTLGCFHLGHPRRRKARAKDDLSLTTNAKG